MTPPVGNAIQGAYVVAAVCTGAVFGGLAVVFRDLAECLACLLGGFSLSMWLLTLAPGGLVPGASGKAVFIAAFALAGFGLYFSRWTRAYGLVACISFSGATAAVLGIDCFSRAGLREFWAYLWALNDRLFPPGAVTYPLTRGIRVEIALTVLISAFGIVSQLRLWRLVKERRNGVKKGETAEGERDLGREEEEVGRRVEETTSQERREWERVYGDGTANAFAGSTDSGVGGMESEKGAEDSGWTLVEGSTGVQSPTGSPPDTAALSRNATAALGMQAIIATDVADGRVTVRVVEDDTPNAITPGVPERGSTQPQKTATLTASYSVQDTVGTPGVYPPFTIPASREEDDRSSAATFADDGDRVSAAAAAEEGHDGTVQCSQNRVPEAEDFAKRASTVSDGFRRSLSQRSAARLSDNIEAGEGHAPALGRPARDSRGDIDSILANLDDLSSTGDVDTIGPGDERKSLESAICLEEPTGGEEAPTSSSRDGPTEAGEDDGEAPDDVGTVAEEPNAPDQVPISESSQEDAECSTEIGSIAGDEIERKVSVSEHAEPRLVKPAESTTSSPSVPASLTKDNLPPPFSHVALAYRTNEWAKHLNIAETPEPDALKLQEYAEPVADPHEQPAPLDVIQLQQTAENAAPPPAAPRASSVLPSPAPHQVTERNGSRASLSRCPEMAGQSGSRAMPRRPTSVNNRSTIMSETIAEEGDAEPSQASAMLPPTEAAWMARSSGTSTLVHHRLSMPTPTPHLPARSGSLHAKPQTLMSLRESLLRNRVSAPFATTPYTDPLDPAMAGGSRAEPDPDDLPLSQRRILIRQTGLDLTLAPHHPVGLPTPTAESVAFDSHQPLRRTNSGSSTDAAVSSEAIRQAKLAMFRQSVAADLLLQSASSSLPPPPPPSLPMAPAAAAAVASTRSLPLPLPLPLLAPSSGRERDSVTPTSTMIMTVDLQRSMLLSQKEADAQRRERARLERERADAEFEARMRHDGGLLLGAHREALRRLQSGAGAAGR